MSQELDLTNKMFNSDLIINTGAVHGSQDTIDLGERSKLGEQCPHNPRMGMYCGPSMMKQRSKQGMKPFEWT